MYSSDQQRKFFHSPGAAKAGITPTQVKEYDQASKGTKLPERATKLRTMKKVTEGY